MLFGHTENVLAAHKELLSTVICGRCYTPVLYLINTITQRFTCKCGLKTRVILQCTFCKKSFLNLPYLVRKTNYCSCECYWIGTNRTQKRICKACGKEFNAPFYLVSKGYGLYCGQQCWFNLFESQKKTIKCLECGKKFLVINAVYKKRPKFCSKKCKDDFERDYVERICKNCQKLFMLPRFYLNRGRGTFCTRDCYIEYKGETSIEAKVKQALEQAGIEYIQEAKLGFYRVDFLLKDQNIALECDGEYWHSLAKAKFRDKRKDTYLRGKGLNVLRLSESTIVSTDEIGLAKLILRINNQT